MIRRFQWLAMAGILNLQQGAPDALFEIPVGSVVCRQLDISVADSADSIFEFADGEITARESLAAFDSTGGPLYMTVQLTELQPQISISHNVAVRFSVGGQYIRIERQMNDRKVVENSAPVVTDTDLKPIEVARSRKFAEWLWEHRCVK